MTKQSIPTPKLALDLQDPATQRLVNHAPEEGDRVAVHGEMSPSGHGVEILMEYRGEAYRVARVAVDAAAGSEITSGDLGIPVKQAAERALAAAWAMFGETVEFVNRTREFEQRQRRRWLTDDFLNEVADTYRSAERKGASSVIEAVAEHFHGGYSSAQRWVKHARERGFLEPSQRSRKG